MLRSAFALLGVLLLGGGAGFSQDQCAELRAFIAQLDTQLARQQQALTTKDCEGPARSICERRIQTLNQELTAESAILRTCKNGVIPTSGIPAPPPHLPMDLKPLSGDDYDHSTGTTNPRWDYYNGIPRNPLWASQLYDDQLPDPVTQCNSSIWSYHPSDWLGCTTDHIWINQAKCGGGGHVNWWPVSYTGDIQWDEHSSNDDDYNIRINRNDPTLYGDDKALYTTSNQQSVLMEFDSDETIDPFSHIHKWWHDFRQAVDSGTNNPLGINGRKAVVIGLVGLDYEHSAYTELHPLYALAINTAGDKWSFFVRNWGDEGYCSSGKIRWGLRTISLLLDNPQATNAVVSASTAFGTAGTSISAYFVPHQGEVIEVQLPDPKQNGFVVGDLEVLWTPVPPARAEARPIPKRLSEEAPDSPEAKLDHLFKTNPSARKALTQAKLLASSKNEVTVSALTLQVRAAASLPVKTTKAQGIERAEEELQSPTPHDKAVCAALGKQQAKYPELCKK